MKPLNDKQLRALMVGSIISGLNLKKQPSKIVSKAPRKVAPDLTTLEISKKGSKR